MVYRLASEASRDTTPGMARRGGFTTYGVRAIDPLFMYHVRHIDFPPAFDLERNGRTTRPWAIPFQNGTEGSMFASPSWFLIATMDCIQDPRR